MKTMKIMVVAAAFCAQAAFGVELSWQRDVLREKIDLSNLAALPVGLELGRFDGYDIPGSGGMVTCKVPPELGKGGRCAALRVSDVFVECGSRRILGGMGSNVYPTVDAGIYAMTNQIVAAVMKVSSGKATVTRLQMNRQGGYGEVKFWWKGEDAAKELELVVRGYVNAQQQMAVCTFLHTKGDGIRARFGQ
jgi:hypothetical protein